MDKIVYGSGDKLLTMWKRKQKRLIREREDIE